MFLAPGITKSAYAIVGYIKSLKEFFTNLLYCARTLTMVLPLYFVSLLILLHNLISSKHKWIDTIAVNEYFVC